MKNKFKIVGFSGSLRKGSYNSALLREASRLAPKNIKLEIIDISKLPLFNQDFENEDLGNLKEIKRKVKEADGVLFSSPEYNYSISGVLKNAIDCISRPYGDNSFQGKPAAIMGASIGMIGTARMQYHLRQAMVFLDMKPINSPEIMVSFAQEKFDEQNNLTDEKTKEKIKEMFASLIEWINVVNVKSGQ